MNPNEPQNQNSEPLQPPLSAQPPVAMPFTQAPSNTPRKRSFGVGVVLAILVAVAVIIAMAVVFWQKNQQQSANQNQANSQATVTDTQKEEKTLVKEPEYTTTNCYRFIAPEGYTASVDAPACKVTLTHKTTPTSAIDIYYVSGVEMSSGSAVEYSIERTKFLAEQQKLQVSGSEMLNVNDYTTGVLYFVNANKQKKAFYAIDNIDRKSKTPNAQTISVFAVTGIVDTEQQIADVRLVVSSFVIL